MQATAPSSLTVDSRDDDADQLAVAAAAQLPLRATIMAMVLADLIDDKRFAVLIGYTVSAMSHHTIARPPFRPSAASNLAQGGSRPATRRRRMRDLVTSAPQQKRARGCPSRFAPPSCPRKLAVSPGFVDEVIDRVTDMNSVLQGWSRDAWRLLDQAASLEPRDIPEECLEIAMCCAAISGRGPLLSYAARAALKDLPAPVAKPAAQAIRDAVVGMLLADILPTLTYAVLTRPMNAAAAAASR